MILFGVNFNIYFLLRLKNWKAALKNEELRGYLGIILASMAVITLNIMGMYGNILHAFRYASFQVGAIITTTGFCTANFDQWPELSKVILLAGTDGDRSLCRFCRRGQIKVSRFLILMKSVKQEIRRMLHPKSVTTIVQINGKKVGRDTMHGVYIYFICYILIMMLSVLLVSINNYDFTTTFSSVLTTLNNVGPGLAQGGAD